MKAEAAENPLVPRGWLASSLEQVRMTVAEEIAANAESGVRLQALMAWTDELYQRAFGERAPAFEMEVRPQLESLPSTRSGGAPGGARAPRGVGRQIPLEVQAVRETR